MAVEIAVRIPQQQITTNIGNTIISNKVILFTFCVIHEQLIPAGRRRGSKMPRRSGAGRLVDDLVRRPAEAEEQRSPDACVLRPELERVVKVVMTLLQLDVEAFSHSTPQEATNDGVDGNVAVAMRCRQSDALVVNERVVGQANRFKRPGAVEAPLAGAESGTREDVENGIDLFVRKSACPDKGQGLCVCVGQFDHGSYLLAGDSPHQQGKQTVTLMISLRRQLV